MTDEPEAPAAANVTDKEVEQSFALTAIFANKVLLHGTGGSQVTRLTFAETYRLKEEGPQHSHVRVSVIIPIQQLLALRDAINKMEHDAIGTYEISRADETDG